MSDLRRKLLSLKKTICKINTLSKSKSRELAESEFNHNKIALEHYRKKIAEMGDIDSSSPKATQLRYSTLKQGLKDAEDREKAILAEHPDLAKPKSSDKPSAVSKQPFPQDSKDFQQHLKNKTSEELSSMHENLKNFINESKKDPHRDEKKIQDAESRLGLISNRLDYTKNKRPFLEMHDNLEKERVRRDRAYSLGDAKTQLDAERNIENIQNKIDLIPTEDLHRELSRHKDSMDPNLPKNKPLFDKHQEKTRRLEDQINRSQNWNTPERKERDAYKKQLEGLSPIDKNAALHLFDKEKWSKQMGFSPSGTDQKDWKKPLENADPESKFKASDEDLRRQKIKQQEAKIAAIQAAHEKELDPNKKNQQKNFLDDLTADLENLKSESSSKKQKPSDMPSKEGKQIGEKQRIISQVGHNEDGTPHKVARIYSWEPDENGKNTWQLKDERSNDPQYHLSGHKMTRKMNRADISDRSKYDENGVPVTQYEGNIAVGNDGDTHSYTTVSKQNPTREDGQPNEIVRHFKFDGKDKKWKPVKDVSLSDLYNSDGTRKTGTEDHANLSDSSKYNEHGVPVFEGKPNEVHTYKTINQLHPTREDGQPNVITRSFINKQNKDGSTSWIKQLHDRSADHDNFHSDGSRKTQIERDAELNDTIDRVHKLHGIDPKKNLSEQKQKYQFSPEDKAKMEVQAEMLSSMSPDQKADLVAQSNLLTAQKQAEKGIQEKQQKEAYDQGNKTLDPSMEIRRTGNRSDRSNMGQENQLISQQDNKQQSAMSTPSMKSPTGTNPLERWKASKQSSQQVPKVEEAKVEAPKLNPFEQWKAKKTSEIKKSQINKLENLENKITNLKKAMNNSGIGGVGSVKAGAVLPNKVPKGPKIGHNSLASKVKIPSVTNQSKKDPMRSIQQIQNKDIKDLKMKEAAAALVPVVKFEKNGQWSINKADDLPPPIPKEARSDKRTKASDGRTPGPEYWEYPKSDQDNTPRSTIDRWNDEAEANYVRRKKESESQQREPLAASRAKNIKDKLEKFKKRCWKGYEPTPGKKPYSDGSCQPIKKQECGCESKTEKECGCD